MASLLDMAQARLQGLLDIPARAGRALVDPTVFSGLLGAPTLPKQRGIAQAAYGLPPEPNMSVLNPEQAAYMQGYAQGEPLSYLGLLAPFTAPAAVAGAKAVAPQAGMALENYMARQGLLQPLTAYHGTPYTINEGFDISKVGTSAKSSNFGHGIYFAESPDVAGMYMANRSTISSPTEGNLYKVDIPDKLIPKMLNWYEEVPENLRKKLSTKAMEQFGSGISPTTGEKLYKEIAFSLKQAGSKTPEEDASKWLLEQGVPGIKYENMQMVKGQGVGTNNYVMFDPTQVKMLDKFENKLNRKELIEEQIKALQSAGE
jgi:hypothetical protein